MKISIHSYYSYALCQLEVDVEELVKEVQVYLDRNFGQTRGFSLKKGEWERVVVTEKEDGPELNTFMYSVISGIDSSVQGVDIKDGNLYVSSSYGGSIGSVRSSFVTRYNFTDGKNGDRDINISKKEVKRVEVPKMNEEILVTDSGIIINFEAAADCWKSVVIATDRLLAVGNSLWR